MKTMKEYFVVSDIHGFYDELMIALKEQGFDEHNNDHILIVCGDILDRGTQVKEVLEFIYKMRFTLHRAILIRGNHEDLFDDMVRRRYYENEIDISNGTLETLYQLAHLEEKFQFNSEERHKRKYLAKVNFFDSLLRYDSRWDEIKAECLDYYETKNYIFVHGWIPVLEEELEKYSYDKDWRTASHGEWVLARWLNGMQCAEQGVIEPGKTIVCGHWAAAYGNVKKLITDGKLKLNRRQTINNIIYEEPVKHPEYHGIFRGKGIIAIDACTALSRKVNCLHLTEDEL